MPHEEDTMKPANTYPVGQPVRPSVPKGVVAVLVSADGCELANAANFDAGNPAGFSKREAQESRARRALALATMNALASPQLSPAIDSYVAELLMKRLCDQHGCRVVIVPVGHDAQLEDTRNPGR